jgi:carbon storage regulator CsrA
MLVLTRKYQEKIRIGDNITITVLRTKGKAVRLGIEAPTDISVLRGELAFEPAAESDDVSEGSISEVEAPVQTAAAGKQRVQPRATGNSSSWTAESPHRAEQVSLKRVPRDAVAGILPQFAAGTKPLRAMMDQR